MARGCGGQRLLECSSVAGEDVRTGVERLAGAAAAGFGRRCGAPETPIVGMIEKLVRIDLIMAIYVTK